MFGEIRELDHNRANNNKDAIKLCGAAALTFFEGKLWHYKISTYRAPVSNEDACCVLDEVKKSEGEAGCGCNAPKAAKSSCC